MNRLYFGSATMREVQCFFLVLISLLLSLYQGYRGFMFQWLLTGELFKSWSKRQKLFLLAIADGLTFFITSLSGFGALKLCWDISVRIADPAKIEAGTAALLVFLAVYGILGVTGKMPAVLDRWKLPPES